MPLAPLDLLGQRFGRLVVLRRLANDERGKTMWLCKCECGNTKSFSGTNLARSLSTSCGCFRREVLTRLSTTHGHTIGGPTTTYRAWVHMHTRCTNPRSPKYSEYAERGITVCKRWNKFEKFLADMGTKPKGMLLDRINNDKGYYKRNCRWATPKQSSNNRRRRRWQKRP